MAGGNVAAVVAHHDRRDSRQRAVAVVAHDNRRDTLDEFPVNGGDPCLGTTPPDAIGAPCTGTMGFGDLSWL